MTSPSGRIYRFGEFELQSDEHRLLRAGAEIPLRPKPFETLVYLVERHGHLVEKNELLQEVWDGAIVSDGALTRCIKEVRHALADDAHEPRFIQTKSRVGYTFIAEVEEGGASDAVSPSPDAKPRTSRLFRYRLAAVVLALLLLIVGGYALRQKLVTGGEGDGHGPVPETSGPERRMIVVLPFENKGPEEETFFADGMSEEVMTRLAAVKGLGVISRTTAFQYRKTEKTIPEIGHELNVDYALEGSVLWEKGPEGEARVRITPQLIRVADDTHLWARSYERSADRIFEVQSEIAYEVARQLGVTLLESEQQDFDLRPTANLDAYRAYLLGRHYAGQPHFTVESWERVLAHYRQAAEIDPTFALAWAELSRAHSRFYFLKADLSQRRQDLARQALDRALDLAPDAPEVRLALGYYILWVRGDQDQALRELKMAASGRPNDAEVLTAIATLQRAQGRWEASRRNFERAFELSPRDPWIAMELAYVFWPTRQYQQALAACDETNALLPDPAWRAWPNLTKAFIHWSWGEGMEQARAALDAVPRDHEWAPWSWFWQEVFENDYQAALDRLASVPEGWVRIKIVMRPTSLLAAVVYEARGESQLAHTAYEQARVAIEAALREAPDDPRLHSSLGIALAGLGDSDGAIREGKQAVELFPLSKDAFYGFPQVLDLAHIYTLVGENEAAIDELTILLQIPSWLSPSWLRSDPRWDRLRDQPRFQHLLEDFEA